MTSKLLFTGKLYHYIIISIKNRANKQAHYLQIGAPLQVLKTNLTEG